MKYPLSNTVIAVTGEFGPSRTHEALKRWIKANGGTFAPEVTAATTHLICTSAHWKARVGAVKQALRHNHVKVVTYDWFEDTALSKTRKQEGPYLLENVAKERRRAKVDYRTKERQAAKKDVRDFERGVRDAKGALGSGGFAADTPKPRTSPKSLPPSEQTPWAVEELFKLRQERDERTKQTQQASPAVNSAETAEDASIVISEVAEPQQAPEMAPVRNAEEGATSQEEKTPSAAVIPAPKKLPADPNDVATLTDNHHIYRDSTGFDYDIVLTRIDMERNRSERYQLRVRTVSLSSKPSALDCVLTFLSLFESNTSPHTYATHLRHTAPSTDPTSQTLAPINSPYAPAFAAFRYAFTLKTRLHWDERLLSAAELYRLGRPYSVVAAAALRDRIKAPEGVREQDLLVDGQRPFVYRKPREGKPVGQLPGEWLRLGEKVVRGLEGVELM